MTGTFGKIIYHIHYTDFIRKLQEIKKKYYIVFSFSPWYNLAKSKYLSNIYQRRKEKVTGNVGISYRKGTKV